MDTECSWVAVSSVSVLVLAMIHVLTWTVSDQRIRRRIAYALPLLAATAIFGFSGSMSPYMRLACSSLVLLYTFKGAVLLLMPIASIKSMSRLGLAVWSFAWPGMASEPFASEPSLTTEDHKRFSGGMTRGILGVVGFLVVSANAHHLPPTYAGWLGLIAILTTVHLGFSDALTELVRSLGWKVAPLFDYPWKSSSLSDFWSKRWNRPFVEMNKLFFLPWLTRKMGIRGAMLSVFLISGLLHEFAISFPAGSGYGLPLLYFALQGIFVLLERRMQVKGQAWVALIVLAPLPLLFHSAFRQSVILPFVYWANNVVHSIGIEKGFTWLILFMGIAQFSVLAASAQVPTRLRWKEELPRLSSLNHKLMWTYGSFIVFTIVSWGILTLVLADDILKGTRAGTAVSTVIFLFWGLRLLTDKFYFKNDDWPKAPVMQMGHTMLNCLFTFIFAGYGSVLCWHLYRFATRSD